MRIIMDLHTHTVYSHGSGSVEQNAQQALRKDLKLLGIADHGAAHSFFGVNAKKMESMRADIDYINKSLGRTFVLQGVEGNILDAQGTTDLDKLKSCKLDIALVGLPSGFAAQDGAGAALLQKSRAQIARHRKGADQLAHSRDGALCPSTPSPIRANTCPWIADGSRRRARYHGVALEINGSHGTGVDILRIAHAEGVRFIVSSDAHSPHQVGDFSLALRYAAAAAIPASSILNAEGYCWDCEMRLNRIRDLIR